MMCLDLDAYVDVNGKPKPIEIYGSLESDDCQFLDIILLPCEEDNDDCDVKNYRDKITGLMDTHALWDRIGISLIEILF